MEIEKFDKLLENKVAKFEKVGFETFYKAMREKFNIDEVAVKAQMSDDEIRLVQQLIYKDIQLPKRATTGSAGYDFAATVNFRLKPGESIIIPTGIRCKIINGWVLKIYPRSGLGFKYQCVLANTVGIIDSDYYYSDNEGHIFIKLVNYGKDSFEIKEGEKIAQGIFEQYGLTVDDEVTTVRNGGFGSTDKK